MKCTRGKKHISILLVVEMTIGEKIEVKKNKKTYDKKHVQNGEKFEGRFFTL